MDAPTPLFGDELLVPVFEPSRVPAPGGQENLFSVPILLDEHEKTVDEILVEHGTRGGPTEHGWHTREAQYRCPREAVYNERYGGFESGFALEVGSVLHEFLAEHYVCLMEGRSLDGARFKVERVSEALDKAGYVDVARDARRLYYGYAAKYPPETDSYVRDGRRIVAVEKRMERRLPWGELYSVRADLVIEEPDGMLIVDHKTSRAKDVEFTEGWVLEPQMLGLEWCSSRYYRKVVGYSINGIVKTATPDYPRMFFVAEQHLIKDFIEMLRYKHLENQLVRQLGSPPNFAACIRRSNRGSWKCRWFNECALGIRPRTTRQGLKIKDKDKGRDEDKE